MGGGIWLGRDYHPGPEKARIRHGFIRTHGEKFREGLWLTSREGSWQRDPTGRKQDSPLLPLSNVLLVPPLIKPNQEARRQGNLLKAVLAGQLSEPREKRREDLEEQTGRDPVKWISYLNSINSGGVRGKSSLMSLRNSQKSLYFEVFCIGIRP